MDILKATELYASNGCIVWYVNYLSKAVTHTHTTLNKKRKKGMEGGGR